MSVALTGFTNPGRIYTNLPAAALVELALARNEGTLTSLGALSCYTGKRTGRSPGDKFIVKDAITANEVSWGKVNQACTPEVFNNLLAKAKAYLQNRDLFVFDGYVGADPDHRVKLRTIGETAWHSLFARCLFLRPNAEELKTITPDWTIYHAPGFHCDPTTDGTKSEAFVALNFTTKTALIAGTQYAGEIKKSAFTLMNFLLPSEGVFPMHCSANVGKSGDVALFFGLSGTGKTTLSADSDRQLIGDDEHGWSGNGVFNIEGGCYAKTIKLSAAGEPQIWDAIRFGCVLENVPVDEATRVPDFDSQKYTENTRAAYPVDFIPNCELTGMGPHPKNIFFLTCDAFGVLPPLSKLTTEQALQHFLCGYTAKVAGTEAGVTEPTATFSTCFGAPFLPLAPKRYAAMLKEKIETHKTPVWLVNTGWSGGGVGVGSRMKLSYTRALLKAALTGVLPADYVKDPVFDLAVPSSCPGVPTELLLPRNTWKDKTAYDAMAMKLKAMFVETFKQYA